MRAHMRTKIAKLVTKVKTKICKLNQLLREEKQQEMEKSVSNVEDLDFVEEITFEDFKNGVFPWERSAESIYFSYLIYIYY